MTPDHVKAMPEWQQAKKDFDLAFAQLRNFNGWYVKTFRKEIAQEKKNIDKLTEAFAVYESLLSVCWWTLSDEDQEAYAESFKKASDEIEEIQRRITATREVRSMAKAMKNNTLF